MMLSIFEKFWEKRTGLRRLGVGLSFCLLAIFAGTTVAHASSQNHLVTIYVDGQVRSVPTQVTSVGQLLDEAGVHVSDKDLVEPAPSTEILEDSFSINVYRARPVIVDDDGKRTYLLTGYQSPRKIAEAAGLTVYPEDEFTISRVDDIVGESAFGELVTLKRAKLINLNLYGTNVPLHTHKSTVGEVLDEHGIAVAEGDQLTPARNATVSNNASIFIARMGTQIVSQEEVVNFDVKIINDANLYVGQQRIETAGVKGKKVVTYELQTTNGKESARKKIQEVVVTPPTTQVEAHGTKQIELRADVSQDKQRLMAAAGIAQNEWPAADYIISHESGWCPTKWQGSRNCPSVYIPAANGQGPGYGLCQSTPATKMATAGADWQTNPITQLNWCTGYARGRYGSWTAAYNHWLSAHSW